TPLSGYYTALHRSWASDEQMRFHAAAGGTLTALATFLLSSGKAQAILHMRADPAKPWLSVSTISRNSEDVWAASQSRYTASSTLERLHELMESGERFALIGKPCDISALNQLTKSNPKLKEQVVALLTIYCGAAPTT